MVKTETLPTIQMKIDELLKITNNYCFDDLARAIYCINLCINNRSVLESCLALNACLIEYSPIGTERIRNYKEFGEFFDKIFHVMKPSWADDYTVEDFGEVRIRCRGIFFRVIVGTGHNNVFACLNFLPTLAEETAHEIDLYELLEYSSGIIEYFMDVNINDNVREKRFVLPSKELFERVLNFFENECNRYDCGQSHVFK